MADHFFKGKQRDREVFINARLVKYVIQTSPDNYVEVFFDKDHKVYVEGKAEDIAKQLDLCSQ